MNQYLAEFIYYTIQHLRGGVTRSMVRRAGDLLDGKEDWRSHVGNRLRSLYMVKGEPLTWIISQSLTDRQSISLALSSDFERSVRTEERKTSGSSGSPFHFFKDMEMIAQMDAVMWAVYAWHGIRPGDRQARFWGMPVSRVAKAKRHVTDFLQNRRRLNAFEVTPTRSAQYYRKLLRFRPRYVYGYPTLIHEFVSHCKTAGLNGELLKINKVICTGEILAPVVRADLEKYFGCQVVNEYGCTESGIIAITCEAGVEHLLPIAVFAEVVGSSGEPKDVGEVGNVVITDLYGSVGRLFRYRLNDLAAIDGDVRCRCGRTLPRLIVQSGRIDSFIETPVQGRVYDAILAYTVPPEVLRFRVTQTATDRLKAELMPGMGYDPSATPEICRLAWERALGPGLKVEVETVDNIPLTISGKLRYFVPMARNPTNMIVEDQSQ